MREDKRSEAIHTAEELDCFVAVAPRNDVPLASWPGHSRSKNGVASLPYIPAIHVFGFRAPPPIAFPHKLRNNIPG
jgi:hypothetical protein